MSKQLDISRFLGENGNWLPYDEWPRVTRVATCRTRGCKAHGQSSVIELFENVDGKLRAVCVHCGRAPELSAVPESAEAGEVRNA